MVYVQVAELPFVMVCVTKSRAIIHVEPAVFDADVVFAYNPTSLIVILPPELFVNCLETSMVVSALLVVIF